MKDWLDVPDHDFTETDVRTEFDSDRRRVAGEYVAKIIAYYNGRRKIFLKFVDDFSHSTRKSVLKYKIPYELNHFETAPFDVDLRETQHDSYFEVKTTEDEK